VSSWVHVAGGRYHIAALAIRRGWDTNLLTLFCWRLFALLITTSLRSKFTTWASFIQKTIGSKIKWFRLIFFDGLAISAKKIIFLGCSCLDCVVVWLSDCACGRCSFLGCFYWLANRQLFLFKSVYRHDFISWSRLIFWLFESFMEVWFIQLWALSVWLRFWGWLSWWMLLTLLERCGWVMEHFEIPLFGTAVERRIIHTHGY